LLKITKLSFSRNADDLFAILDLARWRSTRVAPSSAIEKESNRQLQISRVAWSISGSLLVQPKKENHLCPKGLLNIILG
jgi:hypothetical protein